MLLCRSGVDEQPSGQPAIEARVTEARFAVAFQRSPVAMTIARVSDGAFLEVNASFLALVELRLDEVIGKSVFELGLLDQQASQEVSARLELSGRIDSFEMELRTRSGKRLFVLKWIEYIELAGELCALSTIVDITERKLAEAGVRENEERLRRILEATSDAVFVREVDGRFVDVNSVAVARYGYSREELLTMGPQDLMHADVLPQLIAMGPHALRTGLPFESRHVRKDGTEFPVDVIGCPLVMNGKTYIYSSCRDISERKRAQAQTEELQAQLIQAQKLEVVGQLAGGIAHDFNNILAAMIMQIDLLRMEAGSDAEHVHQAADELLNSAQRAADLTRQLLLFGRRQPMQLRRQDLNLTVTELTKMLKRLIGEPIALRVEVCAEALWVEGDAGMIGQVLTNLCVNARDAMPNGGRLTITTRHTDVDAERAAHWPAANAGRYACIEVSDSGSGIEPSVLSHIFEPFFTTKPVGRGTGLGLSTTHGIVAHHGGFLDVESVVGAGTTLRVFIPSADPGQAKGAHANAGKVLGGTERILVVEDDPAVRRVVVRSLRQLGYQVTQADDGVEALRLWAQHSGEFDLVFTDMVMPEGLSGLDLHQQLRLLRPELRTIIVSGYTAEVLDRDSLTRQGVTYLVKPFDMVTVAGAVRACLDAQPEPQTPS